VKSQGGRTINDKVVQEIKKHILSEPEGHDQVLIIALGDNNLRPKGLKSGFSVDDVIRWHQNVVQLVTSIERLSLDPVFIYNCQNNLNVIAGAL
jgi:hypothetical protein